MPADYTTPRFCSVDDCDRKHSARGYCHWHYARWSKGIPLDKPIREWGGRKRIHPPGIASALANQRWIDRNPERRKETANKYNRRKLAERRTEKPDRFCECGVNIKHLRSDVDQCNDCRPYAWYRENPERHRINSHNRRVRQGGAMDYSIIPLLRNRQKNKCGICDKALTGTPEIDHILPVVLGGTNHSDNLQLAHKGCNSTKRARLYFFPPSGGQGKLALGL